MSIINLTRGQLERSLVQRIQNFYRQRIGQRPSHTVCQFFDSTLIIVVKDVVSPAEKTLMETGREEFAGKLRSELDEAIKPQLKEAIEEIIQVSIITVLIDSDLINGYTSITAILVDTPLVSDPESIPKAKKGNIVNLETSCPDE